MSTTTTAMGSGSECDRDQFTSIAERWGYRSDGVGELLPFSSSGGGS